MTTVPSSSRADRPSGAAEFDAYASDYDAGMGHPLKKLLGAGQDQYLAVKTDWLARDLRGFSETPRLLDFGCGEGAFLRQMVERMALGSFFGCDVSPAMIRRARQSGPPGRRAPEFTEFAAPRTPYPDGSMDVVSACMVFHHIPPLRRAEALEEMFRVVRPGGRVYVFEHNPMNPLTRRVVRQTPIDRNAILVPAAECLRRLRTAGAIRPRLHFQLFTPPRLRFLRPLDSLLSRIPLGAGYAVRAEKPIGARLG